VITSKTATIIMAIHNEQDFLPFSLKPLLDHPDIPVIFVLDRCTDKSQTIIEKFVELRENCIMIVKQDVKTTNPVWEAYLFGAKLVQSGVVLFLGADVILDPNIFRHIGRSDFMKFRYVNYPSHFGYALEKSTEKFRSARHYLLECIDVKKLDEINWEVSEDYGITALEQIEQARTFNEKNFLLIDNVECLHLRQRTYVQRQFLSGYIHFKQNDFLRMLLDAIIYRKPHMVRGYFYAWLRSKTKKTSGVSSHR